MKLALLTTHPVQYYAPWFRHLAASGIHLRVFYLWDFGTARRHDSGFGIDLQWDIPLLDGYDSEFVPNTAPDPGTHHFQGIRNPSLTSRVRAWNPDAVLLMGYAWRSLTEFALRWNRRTPVLLRGDSHDLARSASGRAAVSRLAARLLFTRFSAFLHCGTANRAYFAARGARAEQLHFCPHAIDMERFQRSPSVETEAAAWRAEWGASTGRPVVLFAGKLEEKKRPYDLLHAFRSADLKDALLVFAGTGPQEERLKRGAEGHPRIRFVPFTNQSRMPGLYAAADLFVLPSCGPGETWGLAVQEALACGVPALVSTHVGCAGDLVRDGVNGAIFPAGDLDALAVALRRALAGGEAAVWKAAARTSLGAHTYAAATQGVHHALAGLP